MEDKATRERLRRALVILASLAMLLVAAAPALTQEGAPVTGILTKPEITTYQYGTHLIVDEATSASYALESGSVDLDAYVGQAVTLYGTPVPGYQDGQIEGGPNLLNVTSVDAPAEPVDPASRSPEIPPPAPPGEEVAIQAAQAALQASDIAQSAEQSAQQATETGDLQAASQAAEEARQASETAQVAAEEAQQAAEQTGDPDAGAAAQEAQQAADEAQESSGAAQTVAEVAQQAVQRVADIEETYAEALKAVRSDDENNLAFAAEYGPEEAGPTGTNAGKDSGGENTREDTGGGKKTGGKKDAVKEDTGKAGSEEDTGGVVGSNTSAVTPARGSVPLLLGGSVLLIVGVFVARKLIR